MRTRITREVEIPDRYKLELYKRAPELGPRILFFSGGTALRKTSRELIRYTHNSIHLITPFDSGGSSAVIREAFAMPAVGDIRNRLMALADQSIKGNPEIFELFTHRLSEDQTQTELRKEIASMAEGKHRLVQLVPDPMRKIIRDYFHEFMEIMPDNFNLKGASIGNLVLTAGYLANERQLDPVIYLFSKLVQVRGRVRPTVNKDLHLAVRLEDNTLVIGQHKITGKGVSPLTSPIADIWLTESLQSETPVQTSIHDKVKKRIAEADLICYPIGSFYSSVIANLLPQGVGKAVAQNFCPKVFVPNTGDDPESRGLSVARQVELLQKYLVASGAPSENNGLGYVVIDSKKGEYHGGMDLEKIQDMRLTIIDSPMITKSSTPLIDGQRLSEVLSSLA